MQPLVKLNVLDWSHSRSSYFRELSVAGACVVSRRSRDGQDGGQWDGKTLPPFSLLTCTVTPGEEDALEELRRGVLRARPALVWVDVQTEKEGERLCKALEGLEYRVSLHQVSGRTLQDQVWWRRWVVLGSKELAFDLPCKSAEEEPVTEIPKNFATSWMAVEDRSSAVEGALHLDPSMPYLEATKPKPCGTLRTSGDKERRLVWSPTRPLPSLHRGSWDPEHRQSLLLHVARKEGPAARVLLPEEAVVLLQGRIPRKDELEVKAAEALVAAPRKLAQLAGHWASQTIGEEYTPEPDRVGLCRLNWEEETERVMLQWVKENPPVGAAGGVGRVGGRRGRRSREEKPESFYISKALSRLLRHEAGTADIPISNEGWVKWEDMMKYQPLQQFSQNGIYDAIMINEKQRFTAVPDEEQVWWVAAWSGHTIPDVVGPSRVVPAAEVPRTLVHGTYRRHVPHIETKGILRGRRDIHLQDPQAHARRWRKGLETKITIDVGRATELGCRFRVTGNLVWLRDRDIPTDAIESIREWDDLESGPSQVVGAVGRGADTRGIWGPDEEEIARNREEGEQPITERVAAAAKDLGEAVSSLQEGESVVMDASTWEVEIKRPSAASSSPGQPEVPSEEECDWSGEDTEVEVVEALPASSSTAGAGTKDEIEEGAEDKTEVLEDAPKRRKTLRFGSAQIHILQADAAADTANWSHSSNASASNRPLHLGSKQPCWTGWSNWQRCGRRAEQGLWRL